MIVTLDTNVIFSAIHSNKGASHQILQLALGNKIRFALTNSVYFEYDDVLTRPDILAKLRLTSDEVEKFLDVIALLAKQHSVYFLLRPNLGDEKDNCICECAFTSQSQFLITSNIKDFKHSELKKLNFKVTTPREFYNDWSNIYDKCSSASDG